MKLSIVYFFLLLLCPLTIPVLYATERAIFDVHIHYSHDVWDAISPQQAVRKLREAGIKRALVSSSSDEGTQRLYQAAPELVIPSLRPYRKRGELDTWMHDESVIPYLKQRLAKYQYAAIGEFHVDGENADEPVIVQLVELAKEHDLILHAHSDAYAIERLFTHDPNARIIWAHAGFEHLSIIKSMLDHYPNLWVDLSFRWEIFRAGRFLPGWRKLLINHADRFMLGVDTYIPERWLTIQETVNWYEEMFAAFPDNVSDKIRYQNAERLFATSNLTK